MGRENHDAALWSLIDFIDKDRAASLKGLDNVLVVDDLLPHVNRGSVVIQGLLNGNHCPVDTCAIASGGSEKDLLGRLFVGRGVIVD